MTHSTAIEAAHAHRLHQAHHFDHEIKDPEFEVSRPRGTGLFYTFLMNYKVGAALKLTGDSMSGKHLLDACAGSGMDAEILQRHGAAVVALDISVGALKRAQERAGRYGLRYRLVAGDTEQLPFQSNAFDYSFVHDGLHHLADPHQALTEMARVARRGVTLAEPADAWLTAVAVKLRILPELEDSGNPIYRLHPTRLTPFFRQLGFRETRWRRYLVKYPHQPGLLFLSFGLPGVFPVVRVLFEVLGVRLLSPLGNKLSFVALRSPTESGRDG